MKSGVTLSTVAHAAILTWGLWSFGAPPPLEVAEVELINVDVVPFEEFTQSVEGDRKAELKETPAPLPTSRPDTVPDAINTGDTKNDVKSDRSAEPDERPVEVAKAETPPPAPLPTPSPEREPVPQPEQEEAPAPTPEVSNKIEEKVPLSEVPVSETPEVQDQGEQFAALPKTISVAPTPRPEAPQPKKAETTERKKAEEPAKKQAATSDKKEELTTDKIAALLNKEKPASAGAKSSNREASLGSSKPSNNSRLSQSELDALKSAIERCWSLQPGWADAEELRATVTMRLTPDGEIDGSPEVSASGGDLGSQRAFAGSAKRAVQQCAPYSLPKDKYDTWAEVVVNFDASDMF